MERKVYVVSYDVSDNKRRLKIMHLLEGYGERVQYSVFEVWTTSDQMEALRELLVEQVEEGGSVRVYPLCGKCEQVREVLGKGAPTEVEAVQIV